MKLKQAAPKLRPERLSSARCRDRRGRCGAPGTAVESRRIVTAAVRRDLGGDRCDALRSFTVGAVCRREAWARLIGVLESTKGPACRFGIEIH
jgi:hypothetical protein